MKLVTRRRADVSSTTEPDAALLARVASGDASALGAAFDRYHRDVYAFLARVRGASCDLDDLVQTTFLALPLAAQRFEAQGSARAFILGVALQHSRRERRKLFRRWTLWQSNTHEIEAPVAAPDPEQHAVDRESIKRFEKALAGLPEAQRETFVLVEIEGLKGDEAARALDVPVNTVWTRLHHARAALRASLRTEGAR